MAIHTKGLRVVSVLGLSVAAVLLLVPFATFVMAGTSPDDVDGTLESPGSRTLRVGWPELQPLIQTLNPLFAGFDPEFFVIWSCYSTLLTRDVDGNLVGDLAVEWDILPDGVTWHFEIVKTAKFYDRTVPSVQQPLTVSDVIFTYWLVQNSTDNHLQYMFPEIPSAGGRLVEDMWANGDYEMWIKLRVSYAPFMSVLTTVPVLPQYIWSSEPVDWRNYDAATPPCVGSGPWYYGLDAEPDAGVVEMYRSPTWFGTVEYGWQLHVDRMILRSETEDSNYANYITGTNDICTWPTSAQFLSGLLPGTKWTSSQGFVLEFNMNQLTEADRDLYGLGNPTDYNSQLLLDPVVKRALQMSIDKDAIVDEVLQGLGSPADSLVPESSPWRYDYGGPDAPPGEDEIAFDTTNARLMLYADGWRYRLDGSEILPVNADYLAYYPLSRLVGGVATDTLTFRFVTPNTDSFFTEGSLLIEQWAAQAGVDLLFSAEPSGTMNSIWYAADYDTWFWDWWFTPNSEPTVDVMQVLTTEAIGSWSDVFWSNATYDALYDESLSEMDPYARGQILDEMQRMAYEDSGCFPVAWMDTLYAAQSVTPDYWQNWGNWTEDYPLTVDSGYPWLFTQIYPADNPAPQITAWTGFYEGLVMDPIAFTATAVDSDELEFMWNFGDGTKSAWLDSPNVTHTYTEDGFFDAWLIVREVGTLDGFITSQKAIVRAWDPTQSAPHDLDFTYEPSDPNSGTLVCFNGTATDDEGDPLTYTWDFGDGTADTGQNVVHQFASGAGSYEVTMGVHDGHFGTEPRPVYLAKTVIVSENSAPWIDVPDVTFVRWKVTWEFEVLSGDSDPSDNLLFTWNWGDGSPMSVTTTNVTWHTYSLKLTFNLTVWCDDQTGLEGHNVSDSGFVLIGYENYPPVITDFSVSNDTPTTGSTVTFRGNASDFSYDLLAYSFEFGDGSHSNITSYPDTEVTVNHSYSSPGAYLAYLFVSDGVYSVVNGPIIMSVTENHPPSVTVQDEPIVWWKTPYEFRVVVHDEDPDDVLLFTWYWGDGNFSATTVPTAVHTYEDVGIYDLTVWVDDQTGLPGHNISDTGTVVVLGCSHVPLITDFHVSNNSPAIGEAVTFYGTATDLWDLLTFFWDFGDGTTDTSTQTVQNETLTIDHVYTTAGVMLAYLTVTDGQTGVSTPDPVVIDVQFVDLVPPNAVAVVLPNPVMAGELATFDARDSTDNIGIVNFTWTFVDGVATVHLYGESVSYIFLTEPQSVQVTLNVSDAEGNWDSDTVQLEVAGVIPEFPTVILPVASVMSMLLLWVLMPRRTRNRKDS